MAPVKSDKVVVQIVTGSTTHIEELTLKGKKYVSPNGKIVVNAPKADKVAIQVTEGKHASYSAACTPDKICKIDDRKTHRSITVFFAPSAAEAISTSPSEVKGLIQTWIKQQYKDQPERQTQVFSDLKTLSNQFKAWHTYGESRREFDQYFERTRNEIYIPFNETRPTGLEAGRKEYLKGTAPSAFQETAYAKLIANAKNEEAALNDIIHELDAIKKSPREQQLKVSTATLSRHYHKLDAFEEHSWKTLRALKQSIHPGALTASRELQASRDVYNQWAAFVYGMIDQKTVDLVLQLRDEKVQLDAMANDNSVTPAAVRKAKQNFAKHYTNAKKLIQDDSKALHLWKGKNPREDAIRSHLKELDAIYHGAPIKPDSSHPAGLSEADKKDLNKGKNYLSIAKSAFAQAANYQHRSISELSKTYGSLDALLDDEISLLIKKHKNSGRYELKKMFQQVMYARTKYSKLSKAVVTLLQKKIERSLADIQGVATKARSLSHSAKPSMRAALDAQKAKFAALTTQFNLDLESASSVLYTVQGYRDKLKKLETEVAALSISQKKHDESKIDPTTVKLEAPLKKISKYFGNQIDKEIVKRKDLYRVAEIFAGARKLVENAQKDNPNYSPPPDYTLFENRIRNAQKINLDFINSGALFRSGTKTSPSSSETDLGWLKVAEQRQNAVEQARDVIAHLDRLLGPNRFQWRDTIIVSESERDLSQWMAARSWASSVLMLAHNAEHGKFPRIVLSKAAQAQVHQHEVEAAQNRQAVEAQQAHERATSRAFGHIESRINSQIDFIHSTIKRTGEVFRANKTFEPRELQAINQNLAAAKAILGKYASDFEQNKISAGLNPSETSRAAILNHKVEQILNNEIMPLEYQLKTLATKHPGMSAKAQELYRQADFYDNTFRAEMGSNDTLEIRASRLQTIKNQLLALRDQAEHFDQDGIPKVRERIKSILGRIDRALGIAPSPRTAEKSSEAPSTGPSRAELAASRHAHEEFVSSRDRLRAAISEEEGLYRIFYDSVSTAKPITLTIAQIKKYRDQLQSLDHKLDVELDESIYSKLSPTDKQAWDDLQPKKGSAQNNVPYIAGRLTTLEKAASATQAAQKASDETKALDKIEGQRTNLQSRLDRIQNNPAGNMAVLDQIEGDCKREIEGLQKFKGSSAFSVRAESIEAGISSVLTRIHKLRDSGNSQNALDSIQRDIRQLQSEAGKSDTSLDRLKAIASQLNKQSSALEAMKSPPADADQLNRAKGAVKVAVAKTNETIQIKSEAEQKQSPAGKFASLKDLLSPAMQKALSLSPDGTELSFKDIKIADFLRHAKSFANHIDQIYEHTPRAILIVVKDSSSVAGTELKKQITNDFSRTPIAVVSDPRLNDGTTNISLFFNNELSQRKHALEAEIKEYRAHQPKPEPTPTPAPAPKAALAVPDKVQVNPFAPIDKHLESYREELSRYNADSFLVDKRIPADTKLTKLTSLRESIHRDLVSITAQKQDPKLNAQAVEHEKSLYQADFEAVAQTVYALRQKIGEVYNNKKTPARNRMNVLSGIAQQLGIQKSEFDKLSTHVSQEQPTDAIDRGLEDIKSDLDNLKLDAGDQTALGLAKTLSGRIQELLRDSVTALPDGSGIVIHNVDMNKYSEGQEVLFETLAKYPHHVVAAVIQVAEKDTLGIVFPLTTKLSINKRIPTQQFNDPRMSGSGVNLALFFDKKSADAYYGKNAKEVAKIVSDKKAQEVSAKAAHDAPIKALDRMAHAKGGRSIEVKGTGTQEFYVTHVRVRGGQDALAFIREVSDFMNKKSDTPGKFSESKDFFVFADPKIADELMNGSAPMARASENRGSMIFDLINARTGDLYLVTRSAHTESSINPQFHEKLQLLKPYLRQAGAPSDFGLMETHDRAPEIKAQKAKEREAAVARGFANRIQPEPQTAKSAPDASAGGNVDWPPVLTGNGLKYLWDNPIADKNTAVYRTRVKDDDTTYHHKIVDILKQAKDAGVNQILIRYNGNLLRIQGGESFSSLRFGRIKIEADKQAQALGLTIDIKYIADSPLRKAFKTGGEKTDAIDFILVNNTGSVPKVKTEYDKFIRREVDRTRSP